MNYNIVLSVIGPLIISILTVISLDYIKNKKMKSMNILYYDSLDRLMVDTLWLIGTISIILALSISIGLYIEGTTTIELYKILSYRSLASVIFFSAVLLYTFKSHIVNNIKKNKDYLFTLLLIITLTVLQVLFIVHRIYRTIPGKGVSYSLIQSIITYYISIPGLKFYIGSKDISIIERIRIITQDKDEYSADKISFYDKYIIFYEDGSNKKTLIPSDIIKSIEYKYPNKKNLLK